MANWATVSYAIEGPEETLQLIYRAIKEHSTQEGSSDNWEGNILNELGIEWEKREVHEEGNTITSSGLYMRGFISDIECIEYDEHANALRFDAEEAWGITDFRAALKSKFPDITVYWIVEEPGMEIYATNDKEGEYFPERYWVDTAIDDVYNSEYFEDEEGVYEWLNKLTNGKIKSEEDVEKFNTTHEESGDDCENFVYIHEFDIVEE